MKYYLIIDIGGTKTTSAVFNDQGEPITEFKVKKSRTYEGEDAVFQNTVELAYEVLKEAGKTKKDLAGVGVAAPGPLDYRTGLIIDVPMMGWKNFPLGDRLKAEFDVPVYVENDGNLGALAEANVGVAKGENVVLTIPVSNVGQRDGEEVVQVYLRRPGDKEGPRYTLRAFKRVHIPAGKTESVAIPLTGENFEWFDVESNTMRPLEGTYELLYGGTSDRNKLKTIVMNVQ